MKEFFNLLRRFVSPYKKFYITIASRAPRAAETPNRLAPSARDWP